MSLSPIYKAHQAGMPIHVWVDETRPRNQGMSLTAWELGQMGVAHTVIADNTGGHLMQKRLVDAVIVGSDRTTARGDVCNKIGTYLKALAARDNGVPFYVALPSSTIDWRIEDGLKEIPIEQRDGSELSRARHGQARRRAHRRGRYCPRGERHGELRIRRDAGSPCHRPDHGARRLRRFTHRVEDTLPQHRGLNTWTIYGLTRKRGRPSGNMLRRA
jgi:hypothetical protein